MFFGVYRLHVGTVSQDRNLGFLRVSTVNVFRSRYDTAYAPYALCYLTRKEKTVNLISRNREHGCARCRVPHRPCRNYAVCRPGDVWIRAIKH